MASWKMYQAVEIKLQGKALSGIEKQASGMLQNVYVHAVCVKQQRMCI